MALIRYINLVAYPSKAQGSGFSLNLDDAVRTSLPFFEISSAEYDSLNALVSALQSFVPEVGSSPQTVADSCYQIVSELARAGFASFSTPMFFANNEPPEQASWNSYFLSARFSVSQLRLITGYSTWYSDFVFENANAGSVICPADVGAQMYAGSLLFKLASITGAVAVPVADSDGFELFPYLASHRRYDGYYADTFLYPVLYRLGSDWYVVRVRAFCYSVSYVNFNTVSLVLSKITSEYALAFLTGDYPVDAYGIKSTVVPSGSGTVQIPAYGTSGEVVNFTATPNTGYAIKTVAAVYADEYDDTINLTVNHDGDNYTFVMPSAEVFVRVEFEQKSPEQYNIQVSVTPDGTAAVNMPSISPANVQVNGQIANVSEGYSISNVYAFYLGSNGNPVYLDVLRDGTIFAFRMPSATVNVRVVTKLVASDTTMFPITANVRPAGSGYFTLSGTTHVAGTSLTGDFVPSNGNSLISWNFSYEDTNGVTHQIDITPIQLGNNRRFTFEMPRGDLLCEFITDAQSNNTGSGADSNAQGGVSGTGGGVGTLDPETGELIPLFDDISYAVPTPSLPSVSPGTSGLVLMYNPDSSDLAALGDWLWSDFLEFGENFAKLFSTPMDYIISLTMLPFEPSAASSKSKVKMGFLTPSNVSMRLVTSQWKSIDFGTITLAEYWGSSLDYSPYTTVHLFLPFIGSVQLDTDEVMGHKIGLKYRVDCLSGACVAMVTVDDNVAYQYTGNCAVSIPLTGADFSRVYGAVIGAVGTIAAGFAVGGAAAAALGKAEAGLAGASADMGAALTGNVGADVAAAGASYDAARANVGVAKGALAATTIKSLSNTVSQVMGSKVVVSHSGNISGAGGMLGNLIPYLTVKYPNQSLAFNYKHFVGYPANIGGTIGEFTGYTQCESVIVSGIDATDEEVAEIDSLLKGGVYL